MAKANHVWTVAELANRFENAAVTARRLPSVRVQGYFNPWLSMALQVQERYPDSDRKLRLPPPVPIEVQEMLEAMRWVQLVDVEKRHLIWMRANRFGWVEIGRRFACDRNTASGRWNRALEMLAAQINGTNGTNGAGK